MNPKRYLIVILTSIVFVVLVLLSWGFKNKDHFASISLKGSSKYYRSYDDRISREIQDRDIFYNNIGNSIKNAQKADIIFLGHSMLLFGIQNELIEEFEKRHNIKIFNLAMAGDASGEFLRLIIKRWHLKPKLWIINADDHAANFFSISFDDFGQMGKSSSIATIKYNRLEGYLHVIGRNLYWRTEDIIEKTLPTKIINIIFPGPGLKLWRNVENGNWYLDKVPAYVNPNNTLIKLTRSQNCHSNDAEVKLAKSYLNKIGSDAILILAPYHEFCPQRVKELSNSLNLEYVIPDDATVYSTVDGGGHLDKKGAIVFTKFLLSNLVKTQTFQKLFASHINDKEY